MRDPFFFALAAWLAGVVISLVNQNRKLPITIFALGVAALALRFGLGIGVWATTALAVLSVVIWIANKYDLS